MKVVCLRLTSSRPGFCSHRQVARNPVMRPPTEADRVHVTAADAAAGLEAANPTYGVMIHCLIAAELGDKTQIATIALAAQFLPVDQP